MRVYEREDPQVRFWRRVDKNGPVPEHTPELGCCWVWTGGKNSGYGAFRPGGKAANNRPAHRVSYEWANGPIEPELEIDHLCRNPACVNPAHLEAVTRAVNQQRTWPFRTRVTHCPQGHPYDEENTLYHDGWRRCRTCHAARERARHRARHLLVEERLVQLDDALVAAKSLADITEPPSQA